MKISQFLTGQDKFGYPITINYRGNDTFQTQLGGLCTIVTQLLMLFNFVTLSIAFFNQSKQDTQTLMEVFDRFQEPAFNLQENKFNVTLFAAAEMPRSIGRMRVYETINCDLDLMGASSCQESDSKEAREIELKNCTESQIGTYKDFWYERLGSIANNVTWETAFQCIDDAELSIAS